MLEMRVSGRGRVSPALVLLAAFVLLLTAAAVLWQPPHAVAGPPQGKWDKDTCMSFVLNAHEGGFLSGSATNGTAVVGEYQHETPAGTLYITTNLDDAYHGPIPEGIDAEFWVFATLDDSTPVEGLFPVTEDKGMPSLVEITTFAVCWWRDAPPDGGAKTWDALGCDTYRQGIPHQDRGGFSSWLTSEGDLVDGGRLFEVLDADTYVFVTAALNDAWIDDMGPETEAHVWVKWVTDGDAPVSGSERLTFAPMTLLLPEGAVVAVAVCWWTLLEAPGLCDAPLGWSLFEPTTVDLIDGQLVSGFLDPAAQSIATVSLRESRRSMTILNISDAYTVRIFASWGEDESQGLVFGPYTTEGFHDFDDDLPEFEGINDVYLCWWGPDSGPQPPTNPAAPGATTTASPGDGTTTADDDDLAAPGEPTLPDTGGGAFLPLVAVGLGLLGIGAATLTVSKKRQSDLG